MGLLNFMFANKCKTCYNTQKKGSERMAETCTLCPRACNVIRENGELGFCGAGDVVKIARAALHFWEEPCISGDQGSGTVFFSHCNMKCVYCQNHEISACGKGYPVSVAELASKFLSLQEQGAANINLVTPTHFVPQIISAIDRARERGLHLPIVYNCGGYESVDTIQSLAGVVDVYLVDIKYFSDKYAIKYSAAPNYFKAVSAALGEMVSQTGEPIFDTHGMMKRGVIVRHMMLPGLLFDTKKIIDYVFDTYGDTVWLSLMSQYTPMPQVKDFPELNRKLDPKHYEAMVEYCAEKGIQNAFIQEPDSATGAYIPQFEGE